jgi:hypothetical protein
MAKTQSRARRDQAVRGRKGVDGGACANHDGGMVMRGVRMVMRVVL